MVTATFEIDFPDLRQSFQALPGLEVRLLDVRGSDADVVLCWVGGVERQAFRMATDDDPTIVDCRELGAGDRYHLYRLDLDPSATLPAFHRELVDLDGAIRDLRGTGTTWECDLLLPSRESLSSFYDRCRDLGLSPNLRSINDGATCATDETYGLTPSQHATLVEAARSGYFAVPKEISLVELADRLGVSDQATSERLRRGMAQLTARALLTDDESTDDAENRVQTPGTEVD